MKHKATVKNGSLHILNEQMFDKMLARFEGREVDVIVQLPTSQRSLNQNRYYRGVVVDILSKELGYEPNEMHEILKAKFLGKEINFAYGDKTETIRTMPSTKKLTTKTMEEYLESIRQWASVELGCFIPLPNESEYLTN